MEVQRLVDILPASVRRLELTGAVSVEDANMMLEGILELKTTRVHKLLRIQFEANDLFDEDMIQNCFVGRDHGDLLVKTIRVEGRVPAKVYWGI